jgi:LacI family transcriptional regulator
LPIVTMKDVAKKAGVSVTTVSHVINKTRKVSDGLSQLVLAAMEELGYQRNALARSLRRKKTHTIGMILPDSSNPFFAEVARGIEDSSFQHGYSTILCNSDGDLDKEFLYGNVLAEKQVDGIIFVAAGESIEQIRALQTQNMPLVIIDREIPGVTADIVLTNNVQGGEIATRHLLELGHRRIACITGPSNLTSSAERVTGYRRALAKHSVPVDETLVVRGDFQYESGYRATRQLLAVDNPPSAIFACNDLMAIGAISAVAESGRQVPADLSIVGFDDVRPASFSNPPLTTIAQPKYEMGVVAATMLLERMRNRSMPPRRRLLNTSLLTRRSTASVADLHFGDQMR